MIKVLFPLLFWLSTATCLLAQAQTRQLTLLNPDDTPAADAQVIAVVKAFARVDAKLNPMPSLIRENHFGGTIPIKNNGGTIAFDSKAIAVVAQNSVGFAFVPLPSASNQVKLRPWAKLKLDLSSLELQSKKSPHVVVMWENCFAGDPPTTSAAEYGDDPFGSSSQRVDWRFDKFVMWWMTVDPRADQVLNVPPGEVTVIFSEEDLTAATASSPVPAVRFAPLRTSVASKPRSPRLKLGRSPASCMVVGYLNGTIRMKRTCSSRPYPLKFRLPRQSTQSSSLRT